MFSAMFLKNTPLFCLFFNQSAKLTAWGWVWVRTGLRTGFLRTSCRSANFSLRAVGDVGFLHFTR